MNKHFVGWSSLLGCCIAGLVAWYLSSMFQFHHGWVQLDPLCVERGDFRMPVYFVDRLYTPEAAARLKDVIATEYSEEAIYIDDRGAVHIRPMLYYGNFLDLDRFGQLVLRPEDRPSLPQTPGITCEELQPLVRSPFDHTDWQVLNYPFSFYVFVLMPDGQTFDVWESRYRL